MPSAGKPPRRASAAVRLSGRLYRLLLVVAYPADFRATYGRDMLEMFRDRCTEAVRGGGSRALAGVWTATVADLARHGGAERSARRNGSGRNPLGGLGADLNLAMRSLRKSPGFSAVALLTLALGIGANTAVFSVIDAVLFADLPFPDADRLLAVFRYDAPVDRYASFSYPDIADIAGETETFAGLAPYDNRSVVVASGTEGRRVPAAAVPQSFFDVLSVPPALGRVIQAGDENATAEPVVVLSHALWQAEFGADPELIGHTVRIDSRPYTAVGVMPPEFSYPPGTEAWLPLYPDSNRSLHWLRAIGRLADGATPELAQAEVAGIIARLESEFPGRYRDNSARTMSLREQFVGNLRQTLLVLFLAVGAVLLIGCVNVANLSLARSTARRREIAVRAALGAGRFRIVRQLLTESLVLAAAGGVLGGVCAYMGTDLLAGMVPPGSGTIEAGVNPRLLGFSAALVLLTGTLFGLVPALRSAGADLGTGLKEDGRGATPGRMRTAGRRALVVAEVALAVVLLVAAGLMVRSMSGLLAVDLGFDPADTWVIGIDVPVDPTVEGYDPEATQARVVNFYRDLRDRVAAQRGVVGAGLVAYSPFGGAFWGSYTMAQGQPVVPRPERYLASWNMASPGYFEALGVPLVRGRLFRDSDDSAAEPVAVINETLAGALWPDEDPIGRRVTNGEPGDAVWLTVIGIIADHRSDDLVGEPSGEVYQAHAQATSTEMALVFRAADIAPLAAPIRAIIRDLDPGLTVAGVRPLATFIDRFRAPTRSLMTLLGAFSSVAMLLAAVGIYGVISYGVNQRTHELGVRRALGAQGLDVVRLVTMSGVRLALLGVAVGLSCGWGATRLMESLVYGVDPTDPSTFVAVGTLAVGVALAACVLPALRAGRIDPLVALRRDAG